MAPITSAQITEIVMKFLPRSFQNNPFITALIAGGTTIAVLISTPIFAPIGVIGATGWIVVYIVTGGTFSLELVRRAWSRWKSMGEDERRLIDDELLRLKNLKDNDALTDDEYRERVKNLLDGRAM